MYQNSTIIDIIFYNAHIFTEKVQSKEMPARICFAFVTLFSMHTTFLDAFMAATAA